MIDQSNIFKFKKNIDAALILSDKNRFYFTQFASTAGILVLAPSKQPVFFTDPRYYEMADELKDKGIDTKLYEIGSSSLDMVKAYFEEIGAKTIGYEDTELTVAQFNGIQQAFADYTLEPMGDAISLMRSFKTEEEIAYIKKAQEITDSAFEHILTFIKEGVTEREIAIELEHQMKLLGADGLAFDTIVASGVNGSKPHAHPTDKKVEKGDAITMDFGARYNGYCSDMTRTVFLGEPSKEMRNIYNIVLLAQSNAIKNIKAGLSGKEVDALAREVIVANGYGANFTHSTGHSLGIDIHEAPNASKACETIFRANQLVTIEPGIYIPGVGGVRIEDIVYIKENEIEDLTKSQKTIIIL
ncbi:MAG: aminopeptidase P family protein [Clostridia bacterium]|nr:aminopeptidase P family protein [Clostridia bacterium]